MNEILYHDPKQTDVITTKEHGRGFFAMRDIAPGETLLKELPYAWTIMGNYRSIVCDNCSCIYQEKKHKTNPLEALKDDADPEAMMAARQKKKKEETEAKKRADSGLHPNVAIGKTGMKRCGKCKLCYYCSVDCQKEHWNRIHKYECKMLCQTKYLPENHHALMLFRTILKCSINSNSPQENPRDRQTIDLEPNYEAKTKIEKEVHQCYDFCMSSDLIKDMLNKLCIKWAFEDPYHLIFEYSARLVNNRMALGPDEDCNGSAVGTGIYPFASLLNHNCRPNALWQTYKKNVVIIRAQEHIKKGQEIFIAYLDTTMESKDRKDELFKNYGFYCDCGGCASGDVDEVQFQGGKLEELVEANDIEAINVLPAHNMTVIQKLQREFDDSIRYDRDPEKAYKLGERILSGMSFWLENEKVKHISRPDFRRACGVQYMFMGELALALTKDPRITQAYLHKAETILKITDSEESTVFNRIKKIRSLLLVLHAAHQQAYGKK